MEVRSAATLVEARAAKVRDVVPVPAEGRNLKGKEASATHLCADDITRFPRRSPAPGRR